ncbi:hypothetical protein B9Z55_013669 [Caenorhabditis nigoni]|uniref:Uncharacterized protein n=1 Tax=Caenorhabditis nigoni TaxID=1611254 RepID=A0A2G5U2Y3_9PELO|nr:hypothetical protein B9Z55_013669 [Caenorhabditis nigoni]
MVLELRFLLECKTSCGFAVGDGGGVPVPFIDGGSGKMHCKFFNEQRSGSLVWVPVPSGVSQTYQGGKHLNSDIQSRKVVVKMAYDVYYVLVLNRF